MKERLIEGSTEKTIVIDPNTNDWEEAEIILEAEVGSVWEEWPEEWEGIKDKAGKFFARVNNTII